MSVNIDRLDTFKQSLQTVDKAKVDVLSNSFTELGSKVTEVKLKHTDDPKIFELVVLHVPGVRATVGRNS